MTAVDAAGTVPTPDMLGDRSSGLEVHVELATATKMFCGVPEPVRRRAQHQHLPGLPRPARLAAGAERAGRRAGGTRRAGAQCEVQPSVFARKNYFYPDMPKDFQVSQYDQPINVDGHLDLPSGPRVGHRAGPPRGGHRQVDPRRRRAAASTAPTTASSTTTAPASRCSRSCREPDIRTAEQAREYVAELRAVLLAIGASDAKMEEGSMRVDANVSVRRSGTTRSAPAARSRTSTRLRSLGRAIEYEAGAAGRPDRGGRRGRAGDPSLGRGRRAHPARPAQGGGRRLPLLPRARPRAGRARGGVARGDAGGPRGRCRPTAARALAVGRRRRRDRSDRGAARRSATRTSWRWRRSPPAREPARVLTHVEHNVTAEASADASTRPRSPASSRMEAAGS